MSSHKSHFSNLSGFQKNEIDNKYQKRDHHSYMAKACWMTKNNILRKWWRETWYMGGWSCFYLAHIPLRSGTLWSRNISCQEWKLPVDPPQQPWSAASDDTGGAAWEAPKCAKLAGSKSAMALPDADTRAARTTSTRNIQKTGIVGVCGPAVHCKSQWRERVWLGWRHLIVIILYHYTD